MPSEMRSESGHFDSTLTAQFSRYKYMMKDSVCERSSAFEGIMTLRNHVCIIRRKHGFYICNDAFVYDSNDYKPVHSF